MDKIEKRFLQVRQAAEALKQLEVDYTMKHKGPVYYRRADNLRINLKYHIRKAEKLGSGLVAKVTFNYRKDTEANPLLNNGKVRITELKTSIVIIVDLNRKEIESLMRARIGEALQSTKIEFLESGIPA